MFSVKSRRCLEIAFPGLLPFLNGKELGLTIIPIFPKAVCILFFPCQLFLEREVHLEILEYI